MTRGGGGFGSWLRCGRGGTKVRVWHFLHLQAPTLQIFLPNGPVVAFPTNAPSAAALFFFIDLFLCDRDAPK